MPLYHPKLNESDCLPPILSRFFLSFFLSSSLFSLSSSVPIILVIVLLLFILHENNHHCHNLAKWHSVSNLHPIDKLIRISALSVLVDNQFGMPTLTTMSRHSDISDDSDSPDVKCFQELPDDIYEAIGSEASAIRGIIREQQKLPIKVIKYLRLSNVPPIIAEEFSLRSARHMFSYDTRSMIIKLVTGAHETASRGLHFGVQKVIYDMGLHRSVHPAGSKRVKGVSSSKEADESWVAMQPVPGRNAKWPTVAVEVGVSESYQKLKADAEWWLTNSKGDVKLVIIVSINRETPNIKFETVFLDKVVSSLRHQRRRYIPTIRQSITTSRRGAQITTSPATALTIEFEELFCRQQVPPEHNIEISPDQLEDISSDVWAEQGLEVILTSFGSRSFFEQ